MNQLKTIVIVYDQAYISGGAAKIAIRSAVAMSKLNYRVIFFAGIGVPCDELKNSSIEVICLGEEHIALTKKPSALLKGIWNRNACKKLKELLDTLDPSSTVVHIHGWTKSLSSSVFLAAYRKGFKTLVTGHEYFAICQNGGLYDYHKDCICLRRPRSLSCYLCNCDKRNYMNKIYRNFRQLRQTHILKKTRPDFIFITEFSKEKLKPYLFHANHQYLLSNFVDIEKRQRVQAEKNDLYLFIGRISDEKGIDLFCNAVTKAGVSGVVIGDGSKREAYQKDYPHIQFAGWKNTEEMQEYIQRARAMIVSSKWYETMGLTVVEMQQYGVPCIVPKECAASEYVQDGQTGMLYQIGSEQALECCIKALKSDSETERLSKNFYAALDIEKYSINDYVRRLIKIYENSLNAGK